MRIGVYTIALNEEIFSERWSETVTEADFALVADTGSTDRTLELLSKKVERAKIRVRPWRFDDARNTSLSLLPDDLDVVIALDMDEILMPGWRAIIEREWTDCNRLRYNYIWSWSDNGKPDVFYSAEKISGRFTHRWKNPVHEILTPTVPEKNKTIPDTLVEHHADNSKPRSQYLPLLELSVKENPHDDRSAHYLGREYFFYKQYENAIRELERHLSMPSAQWKPERAASMRYIAKCYECLKRPKDAHEWYIRATLEDPSSREALIDLGRFALAQNFFHATIDCCERALMLPSDGGLYLSERYALNEGPYDLAAVAHYHLGDKERAVSLARIAIEKNPNDPRLLSNLGMMVR